MNNDMRGLEVVAAKGRLLGLDMVYHCASGHLGGSFSAMDILTVLYFDVMRVDPKDPKDPDRDRFVLSKGHCTPALYPILALRGYLPRGGAADVPQRGRPHVRPRRDAPCEGCGYVHRLPGAGHLRRRGHGPGG